MKTLFAFAALALSCFACPALAQSNPFTHIVVVVQENRTPDNLFADMCQQLGGTAPCSTVDNTKYDIQTANWATLGGQTITPLPGPLGIGYDIAHTHAAFLAMCNLVVVSQSQQCAMNGAINETCEPIQIQNCPTDPEFYYVVFNSAAAASPYFQLAQQYGWANKMFQTNQGPSFPAHQFLFGATSAPTAADDAAGIFVAENDGNDQGCETGSTGTSLTLINPLGQEYNSDLLPCFVRDTITWRGSTSPGDWRYYTASTQDADTYSYWNAPQAIQGICQPNQGHPPQCTNPAYCDPYTSYSALCEVAVYQYASQVLNDLQSTSPCTLAPVTWITPTGANSDHAGHTSDIGGPSWVGSIVNAIYNNQTCGYWQNTAIIVVWDDWGGWYDHEPPTFLAYPEGGYQYGFRVPMLFISQYTPAGFISNNLLDFGAIANFIEGTFGLSSLGFADSRTTENLCEFYNGCGPHRPHHSARKFVPIKTPRSISWFMHDRTPPTPPDND